jgi:hypothetical protein
MPEALQNRQKIQPRQSASQPAVQPSRTATFFTIVSERFAEYRNVTE